MRSDQTWWYQNSMHTSGCRWACALKRLLSWTISLDTAHPTEDLISNHPLYIVESKDLHTLPKSSCSTTDAAHKFSHKVQVHIWLNSEHSKISTKTDILRKRAAASACLTNFNPLLTPAHAYFHIWILLLLNFNCVGPGKGIPKSGVCR